MWHTYVNLAVHVCKDTCACVPKHVKVRGNLGSYSSGVLHTFVEAESLTSLKHVGWVRLPSLWHPQEILWSPGHPKSWDYQCTPLHPALFTWVWVWGIELRLYVCSANTGPTLPFPRSMDTLLAIKTLVAITFNFNICMIRMY